MIASAFLITNYKIVSTIRNEIVSHFDIESLQEILATHWKPYFDNLHVCMANATYNESYMCFSIDMKVFKGIEWPTYVYVSI